MSGYPRPRTVRPYPLAGLAGMLGVPVPATDVQLTGVTHDSGSVRPGDLYAALPGAHRHGAQFIGAAAAAGAVAVLTDPAGEQEAIRAGLPAIVVDAPRQTLGPVAAEIYGNPTGQLTVVGITGTAGKTSTAYLVDSGLRAAGVRCGLIGTVQTRLGDEPIASQRTTPEAPDLQALFAVALERGIRVVIMEVSSHALALHRVGGTRFAVGAFTNLGVDHLDFHADLAEYFGAKAMLFDGRCNHEVVNLDDAAGHKLLKPDTVTVSASGNPAATWHAERVTPAGFGQSFDVLGPHDLRLPTTVAMPGSHNVSNALLAFACLTLIGIDPEVALRGIAECRGVPGRMELVDAPGPVRAVVDYAHKPDAVTAVLSALRTVTEGRLICVIGAGGDRDRGKRPLMGRAASQGADLVVVTDDNPRNEEPAAVRTAVLSGVRAGATAVEVAGRRDAIDVAVRLARPGDTIAVLGKGHEQGQEVAGEVFPFDDRVELAASLTQRFGPS